MIPIAPTGTATEPLHGHAQRRAEGRSRDALARAIKVARAGHTPANLDRRLYGGRTIRDALTDLGLVQA